MGEHNTPVKKAEATLRKVYQLDESEKSFAKTIVENFKCDETEAEHRVMLCKRFVLENKQYPTYAIKNGIDLIAAGIVVPTSQKNEDRPLSDFAMLFETEARKHPKSKQLRLSLRLNAGGDTVRVIVMREKFAQKLFSTIAEGSCADLANGKSVHAPDVGGVEEGDME